MFVTQHPGSETAFETGATVATAQMVAKTADVRVAQGIFRRLCGSVKETVTATIGNGVVTVRLALAYAKNAVEVSVNEVAGVLSVTQKSVKEKGIVVSYLTAQFSKLSTTGIFAYINVPVIIQGTLLFLSSYGIVFAGTLNDLSYQLAKDYFIQGYFVVILLLQLVCLLAAPKGENPIMVFISPVFIFLYLVGIGRLYYLDSFDYRPGPPAKLVQTQAKEGEFLTGGEAEISVISPKSGGYVGLDNYRSPDSFDTVFSPEGVLKIIFRKGHNGSLTYKINNPTESEKFTFYYSVKGDGRISVYPNGHDGEAFVIAKGPQIGTRKVDIDLSGFVRFNEDRINDLYITFESSAKAEENSLELQIVPQPKNARMQVSGTGQDAERGWKPFLPDFRKGGSSWVVGFRDSFKQWSITQQADGWVEIEYEFKTNEKNSGDISVYFAQRVFAVRFTVEGLEPGKQIQFKSIYDSSKEPKSVGNGIQVVSKLRDDAPASISDVSFSISREMTGEKGRFRMKIETYSMPELNVGEKARLSDLNAHGINNRMGMSGKG